MYISSMMLCTTISGKIYSANCTYTSLFKFNQTEHGRVSHCAAESDEVLIVVLAKLLQAAIESLLLLTYSMISAYSSLYPAAAHTITLMIVSQ